jgi:hypothetical protein
MPRDARLPRTISAHPAFEYAQPARPGGATRDDQRDELPNMIDRISAAALAAAVIGLGGCAGVEPAEMTGSEAARYAALRAGKGDFDGTGTILCAQYRYQTPMPCTFGVAREGGETAVLSVTKPDGIRRFLFFSEDRLTGADTTRADGYPEYGAQRKGDLIEVYVGEERYEIPVALILGGRAEADAAMPQPGPRG